MKSKTKFLGAVGSIILALTGCTGGQTNDQKDSQFPQTTGPSDNMMAHIDAPQIVDMGVFDYRTNLKTAEIEIGNTGEAPLIISSVVAECECTKILSVDSVVQPRERGKITVSLDMTGYMNDTIYKPIYVISSDPDKHVYLIDLMADNRM